MPLNDEQRAALWDVSGKPVHGRWLLSARPGTGKTTTLTRYCIDLVERWHEQRQPWQGIALLSYTNVAKDELQHKVRELGRAASLLQHPHVAGTVDAFLNQCLFLPHAMKSMAFDGDRPALVGEPYQQWKNPVQLDSTRPDGAYRTMWFDCYSVGLDGKPIRIDENPRLGVGTAQKVTNANTAKILAMKQHVWAHGFALQADANYLAHQALLASPPLAAAIARRFPVVIVDEAQDLTEIQHAIIDRLIAAGLKHVVLVGDEDQAIYEWNTARPELFTAKMVSGYPWTPVSLTQSYRCSPAICATLNVLAGHDSPLRPADDGKNKSYPAPVLVQEMSGGDEIAEVRAAVDRLAAGLAGEAPHDGNHDNVKSLLILTRGTEHCRQLEAGYSGIEVTQTERTVWRQPLTRDFLKVVHQLATSNRYGAVEAYEALLRKLGNYATVGEMRAATRREWGLAEDATTPYRVALFNDLNALKRAVLAQPPVRISDCVPLCEVLLRAVTRNQLSAFGRDCASFRGDDKRKQDRLLSSLFTAREARSWSNHHRHGNVRVAFATAHASKGETHDAVLLVTKKTAGLCGCPSPSTGWKNIFRHSMSTCEAKRIVYVAMSRAAQQLVILTPPGASAPWLDLTMEDALAL